MTQAVPKHNDTLGEDGDRRRNEAEPLLQCVPRRATSPVAHEQTFLN
jgi:hypothetical protein